MLPLQNHSKSSSSHDLKVVPLSVSFHGWRMPNKYFKFWAIKMASLHKPTWQKAGIFEAVMASTSRIHKNTDLILSITEKWCPETNTFVFPWGETTITLEDVKLLLGFSVLGSPVFASLDSSGEKTLKKLEKEKHKLQNGKGQLVTQAKWMRRFMDSGDDDELEHVAFLALWVSYFVFPSKYHNISKAILPICVHLSCGTMIALAPPVLAHLYRDLTLLKHHIRETTAIADIIELTSLFKLVQVWTWERFRELQTKPKMMLEGEPRMARWDDQKKQKTSHVRKFLEMSEMDSFDWRPYTKAVINWKFPRFYPEEAMSVPVDTNLGDEFISCARFVKVCELVGLDCAEHYFPNRVASQFGMVQDVPCPRVNKNNLTKEAAWDEYNKPIDDLTLYIPSRSTRPSFTPMYREWWKKWSLEFHQVVESLTPRKIIVDGDTSNSLPLSSKRQKYVSTIGICQKQVPSDNDEDDDSLTIAQTRRLKKRKKKKNGGSDGFEQPEVDNNDSIPPQKLDSIRANGNCSQEEKNKVLSPSDESNSSCPPKVLPLSQVLLKLGEGFPKKLKRSRYLRTTKSVISEIKKGKIGGDCGGSTSRKMSLTELCQSKHLGSKPACGDGDESYMDCYDNTATVEKIRPRERSGGDAFESVLKKCRPEADYNDSWTCQKLASEDETAEQREIEQRSEENNEEGENTTVMISPNEDNSSDLPLGSNGGVVNNVVSQGKASQTCDDVDGISDEKKKKKSVFDDGTKEAKCLVHEDGEKQRSIKKKDDGYVERLKQKRIAIEKLATNLEARFVKTLAEIRT